MDPVGFAVFNFIEVFFHLCGENDVQVAEWMSALNNDGKYTVSADVADKVKALFAAGCCDDAVPGRLWQDSEGYLRG